MCGIVGVFGNIIKKHENALTQMLIVDQLRGQDSTGMMRVARFQPDVEVVKAVGTPDVLVDSKPYEKALSGLHRALIGHNRFATKGAVNRNNAHPFDLDHITGVHNGSMRVYNKLHGFGGHPVDSYVLYNHIQEHGLRDAVDNSEGAMALVWWDKRTHELNIYRNTERPLAIAHSSKDGVYMIGSEWGMVEWIATRNGIILDTVEEVSPDTHIRFPMTQGQVGVGKPIITIVKKEPKVVFPLLQNYFGGTRNDPVVVETKTTTNNAESVSPSLAELKVERQLFEVVCSHKLEHQAGMLLSCDAYPNLTFFMVDTPNTADFRKGDLVETTCSGMVRSGLKVYYFLTQPNMNHIPCEVAQTVVDQSGNTVEGEEAEQSVGPFRTPGGKDITAKQWYKDYGFCSYCTGDTEPHTCIPTRDLSGVLCEDCAGDASVVVNLC